ncbi:hypothetical protein BJP34_07985 [Moorena producens PAL-8-15-08-1]|uniref:Uncharacterized protein n=1 Tax=Moorena producens PAL-8-15-08-1 TaxID=1458985 RepID=A0A1D8TP78_9CYAN|nr:hypothetical protein [Moorena producens]AOW99403.1 hypothetical protein BJP34_07985 [Moorena producens PAL-8-15-08-1]
MWNELLIEAVKRLGFMFLGYIAKEGLKRFFQHNRNNSGQLIPDIYGTDLLRVILKEHYLHSQEIIEIFGSEATCNLIVSGQQELTIGQIQKLSKRLLISPMAFYPL